MIESFNLSNQPVKTSRERTAFDILRELMNVRRAIRVFDGQPVPEEVMRKAFELAMLTPSASNLHPWEIFWIRSPEIRSKIVTSFLAQAASRTAGEIVVVVARTNTWERNRALVYEKLQSYGQSISEKQLRYYSHVVKDVYNQGFLGLRGLMKRFINAIEGRTKAVIRRPASYADMRLWAVKSASLPCQTLMMAFQSQGYDTCPMEGFDEKRIIKLLNLEKDSVVVMGIAVGKRSSSVKLPPRVRLEESLFIKEV